MNRPTLAQLQAEFKRYLLSGDNETRLALYLSAARDIAPSLRLGVYRNAYYSRLEKTLAHDFPALRAAAGDTAFGRLMAAYLRDHPSTSASLRYLGQALPMWLRQRSDSPLADLAQLEWAVLAAFDAADAFCLPKEALENIAPDRWQSLRFDLHPSVNLFTVYSNARALWTAVRRGHPLPLLQDNQPETLVVWRSAKGPMLEAVALTHYTLLSALGGGQTFGESCVCLAEVAPEQDVPRLAAEAVALALARKWFVCQR